MSDITLSDIATNLFESVPALLGAASLDGRFLKLSDGWATVLGYRLEELEGFDYFRFIHPNDREATAAAVAELSDHQCVKNFINRFRSLDGRFVALEWNATRGRDDLIYFSARDVTERQALNARLEAATKRLEQTADLAGVGGWELSFPDMTVYWDARTRRIHEVEDDYEPEITSAIEFYAPEVRDQVEKMVQSAMETGEPWDQTLPLITAKGRRIWVRTTGRAIAKAGEPERVVGTFQDVTEQVERAHKLEAALSETQALRKADKETRAALRESEARLQSALDATEMGVWTYRPEADLFYISARCASILGRESVDLHMSGQEYRAYIHEDDREALQRSAQDHIDGVNDYYRIEARHRRDDGCVIWAESFGRVVERDATDKPVLLCGTFQEISRRKAQEHMLEESRQAADAANQAKSRFLANMSHEIRTPLNGIMGMTQLLHMTDLDERQRRYVSILDDSSQSLRAIVDDVLDIARIESGRLELQPAPFDLSALLRQAKNTVAGQAQEKSLSLSAELDEGVSSSRVGDEHRILQVLINLAGNAVKFTQSGSVRIKARAGEQDGVVRFVVTDTGPGVSEDQRRRIFERFAQADDTAARAHGGTGLGLSISKQLVELAGGTMGLEPNYPNGSVFWFEWPLPEAADRCGAPHTSQPRAPSAHEAFPQPGERKPLVLVAEDQTANRTLLEEHLAWLGFDAISAENGAQALAALERGHRPDAILMDMHMPVLPGDEAIQKIRARDDALAQTPIFVLTADATVQAKDRLKGLGADEIFIKPLNLEQITETLQDTLLNNDVSEGLIA